MPLHSEIAAALQHGICRSEDHPRDLHAVANDDLVRPTQEIDVLDFASDFTRHYARLLIDGKGVTHGE